MTASRSGMISDPHTDLDRHTPAFGPPMGVSPEDAVVARLMDDDIEQALDALDPRFRAVILLVDVEQLWCQEAADVLGIRVGTIMSRPSRARSRVRKHLDRVPITRRQR